MHLKEMDLRASLKKYFGFSNFKGLQEEVIKSVVNGEHTFVIMPTGGGKSLCYQLPALIAEGTAIVVSPLIALMKNQVDSIRGVTAHKGVAHVLNSSLTKSDVKLVKEDIRNGLTKLLYVAPESLTKADYVDFLKSVPISFVAVDEWVILNQSGRIGSRECSDIRTVIVMIDIDRSIEG